MSEQNYTYTSYSYSLTLEMNFCPLFQVLSNIIELENVFFKSLYSNSNEEDFFSFSNYQSAIISIEDKESKFLIPHSNLKINDLTLCYYINSAKVLKKEISLLNLVYHNDLDRKIYYRVKEETKENKRRDYEIIFTIKNLDSKEVYCFCEILIKSVSKYKNPFNSKVKKAYISTLLEAGSRSSFIGNTSTVSAIIIPTDKKTIFKIITDLSYQDNCKETYEISKDDGTFIIKKEGEIINTYAKQVNLRLKHKVNAFSYSDSEQDEKDKDFEYGAEIIESNLNCPFTSYLNTIKYINKTTSLLVVKEDFKSSLSRINIDFHRRSIRLFMEEVRSVCIRIKK